MNFKVKRLMKFAKKSERMDKMPIAFSASHISFDSITPLGGHFHLDLQPNAGGSLSAKSVLTLLGFLLKTGNDD